MSDEEGYRQALENFAYQVEGLAQELEEHYPGDPFAAVAELLGRGPIYDKLKDRIETLDNIHVVIANTYGKTEAEVDADIASVLSENAWGWLFTQ